MGRFLTLWFAGGTGTIALAVLQVLFLHLRQELWLWGCGSNWNVCFQGECDVHILVWNSATFFFLLSLSVFLLVLSLNPLAEIRAGKISGSQRCSYWIYIMVSSRGLSMLSCKLGSH